MRYSYRALSLASVAMFALASTASAQVPLASCKHPSATTSVAFSADGKTLATGCADQKVRVWDGITFKEKQQFAGLNARCTRVVYAQDGKMVIAGSQNGMVCTWDIGTSQKRLSMQSGNGSAVALAISPDGRHLASGGTDRRVFLRDISTGRFLRVFHGHVAGISGLAISPDGARLATASADKSFRIWDMTNGRQLGTVETKEPLQSLAFSSDGKRLAIGTKEMIRVYDSDPNQLTEQAKMEGIKGTVNAVAFSKDGKMLASASEDGSIQLWDPTTGKLLRHLGKHRGAANGVAFAPSDKFLATTGEDSMLLIWDVSPRIFLPAKTVALSAEDLNKFWNELGGNDFGKAGEAIGTLASAPKQTVPFLGDKLKAARPDEDEKNIRDLIAKLDDDSFSTREKAMMDLEKLGPASQPLLKEAIKGDLPLEARRRAERILEKLKSPELTPDQQRLQRAVTILEITGTPEARKLLEDLAKGGSGTWLALEARSSLERFERMEKK